MVRFDRSAGLAEQSTIDDELDLIWAILLVPVADRDKAAFNLGPVLQRLAFIADLEKEQVKWGGAQAYSVKTKALVALCCLEVLRGEVVEGVDLQLPDPRHLIATFIIENVNTSDLDSEEEVEAAGLVALALVEGARYYQDGLLMDAALFAFDHLHAQWGLYRRITPAFVAWTCRVARSVFGATQVSLQRREKVRMVCMEMIQVLHTRGALGRMCLHQHRFGVKAAAFRLQSLCDTLFMLKSCVCLSPDGTIMEDTASITVKALMRAYTNSIIDCVEFLYRAQNLDRAYFSPEGEPLLEASRAFGGFPDTLADPRQPLDVNAEVIRAVVGVVELVRTRGPSPQPRKPFGGFASAVEL